MGNYQVRVMDCTQTREYNLATGEEIDPEKSLKWWPATNQHRLLTIMGCPHPYSRIDFCIAKNIAGDDVFFPYVLAKKPKPKRKSHHRFLATLDKSVALIGVRRERLARYPHVLVDPKLNHFYRVVDERVGLVFSGGGHEADDFAESPQSGTIDCCVVNGDYILVPNTETDLMMLKLRFGITV